VRWAGWLRSWFDVLGYDALVFADLRSRTKPSCSYVERAPLKEEAGGYGVGVFWLALDGAAAESGDELERARECGGRHPVSPVPLADEAAGDPSVRGGGSV